MLSFIPTPIVPHADGPTDPGQPPALAGAGLLVMWLLIISLGIGLAALLVFYFIMRARAPVWPPPGTPPLPAGLWLSTGVLLLSSATIELALRGARRGRPGLVRSGTAATTALALAFVVSQLVNWGLAVAAKLPPGLNMFSALFYLLTGLHGLHVIGGLIPLVWVTFNARRGVYTPARHEGLRYVALYWHFLDVAWLAMFTALLLGHSRG